MKKRDNGKNVPAVININWQMRASFPVIRLQKMVGIVYVKPVEIKKFNLIFIKYD